MKKIIYLIGLFGPVTALAQVQNVVPATITTFLGGIKGVVNLLIPILIAIAIIYFFWGLITFIRAAGDEKGREAGKSQMLWGIVAIAVMVTLFGLITWLQGATGITAGTYPTPPTI